MLDRYLVPIIRKPLKLIAIVLHKQAISADQVTVAGFVAGLVCITMLAIEQPMLALGLLFLNRLADGVDGELARLQKPTDAGGFLDISLDFVFYALFPLGFALENPVENALPAAILIASFVGTGSSFLAFSSLANKHAIEHPDFKYKSLYYLNGLAEGTETIVCFALMCLFPNQFPVIAAVFALICIITAANRIYFGYRTLKKHH